MTACLVYDEYVSKSQEKLAKSLSQFQASHLQYLIRKSNMLLKFTMLTLFISALFLATTCLSTATGLQHPLLRGGGRDLASTLKCDYGASVETYYYALNITVPLDAIVDFATCSEEDQIELDLMIQDEIQKALPNKVINILDVVSDKKLCKEQAKEIKEQAKIAEQEIKEQAKEDEHQAKEEAKLLENRRGLKKLWGFVWRGGGKCRSCKKGKTVDSFTATNFVYARPSNNSSVRTTYQMTKTNVN